MSLEQAIRNRVDAFVNDLQQLVRAEVFNSVMSTLRISGAAPIKLAAATGKPRKAASGNGVAKPAARAVAKAATKGGNRKAPKASGGNKSEKGTRRRRSAEEIESLAGQIYDFVKSNPGKRAEEIKAALKISPNDWALPIEKLIETGRLTTKGQKRATSYLAK